MGEMFTIPQDDDDPMHQNVDELVAGMVARYKDRPIDGATVMANALGRYIGQNYPTFGPMQVLPLLHGLAETIQTQTFLQFENRAFAAVKEMATGKDKA